MVLREGLYNHVRFWSWPKFERIVAKLPTENRPGFRSRAPSSCVPRVLSIVGILGFIPTFFLAKQFLMQQQSFCAQLHVKSTLRAK